MSSSAKQRPICTASCGRGGKSLRYRAVVYELSIKYPCMRQQSRAFFTAGLSISCACFLKQSCIADSLCAASKAAEDAKPMTRVAAVSSAFMADSFGEAFELIRPQYSEALRQGLLQDSLQLMSGLLPGVGFSARPPERRHGAGATRGTRRERRTSKAAAR